MPQAIRDRWKVELSFPLHRDEDDLETSRPQTTRAEIPTKSSDSVAATSSTEHHFAVSFIEIERERDRKRKKNRPQNWKKDRKLFEEDENSR